MDLTLQWKPIKYHQIIPQKTKKITLTIAWQNTRNKKKWILLTNYTVLNEPKNYLVQYELQDL